MKCYLQENTNKFTVFLKATSFPVLAAITRIYESPTVIIFYCCPFITIVTKILT